MNLNCNNFWLLYTQPIALVSRSLVHINLLIQNLYALCIWTWNKVILSTFFNQCYTMLYYSNYSNWNCGGNSNLKFKWIEFNVNLFIIICHSWNWTTHLNLHANKEKWKKWKEKEYFCAVSNFLICMIPNVEMRIDFRLTITCLSTNELKN